MYNEKYRYEKESVISMASSTAARPRPNNGSSGAQARKKTSSNGHGTQRTNSRAKRRKKRKARTALTALAVLLTIIILVVIVYVLGYAYYKNRFTANTFVNGVEVSGMTFDEAVKLFEHTDIPDDITVTTPADKTVKLSLGGIDYKYNFDEELQKIYNDVDRKSWFAFMLKQTDYNFSDTASYDHEKLNAEIDSADWGNRENVNAKLKSNDDGYYIVPEVQGDVFDMDTLKNYIASNLDEAVYKFDSIDSGAYVLPETVSADYDKKLKKLNELWDISVSYDFNYKKETLTGKKLVDLVNVDREGNYTVDEDACMKYIEKLAKKYDTYNTTRTFKSTLQGKIKVEPSSDAKYGWWLDQEESCDQLVKILEKGKTRKNVEPIYYNVDGYFEFTGVPDARSEKDDIGKTYLEVDLTNQMFWYYKNGKKKRSGYIVSGQTTSLARTTLEGVYKLWNKQTNYRMKDTNADGDSWDVTCNYWNNISLCGIGMHDSTWRGNAFGGNIYTYNGSHGCINMTYSDAQYIYENVPLGTPVVMYY